jgi:flagellar basal body-associated protein FliL
MDTYHIDDAQWKDMRIIRRCIVIFIIIVIVNFVIFFILAIIGVSNLAKSGESFTPTNLVSYIKYTNPATYNVPQNPLSMIIKN